MSDEKMLPSPEQQQMLPVPYYPSEQDKRLNGYQVEEGFDKEAFNAQYEAPDALGFKGESLPKALETIEGENNPNLIKTPVDEDLRRHELARLALNQQVRVRDDLKGRSVTIVDAPSQNIVLGGPESQKQ